MNPETPRRPSVDWLVLLCAVSALLALLVALLGLLPGLSTSWAVAGPWIAWLATALVAYGIAQSRWER